MDQLINLMDVMTKDNRIAVIIITLILCHYLKESGFNKKIIPIVAAFTGMAVGGIVTFFVFDGNVADQVMNGFVVALLTCGGFDFVKGMKVLVGLVNESTFSAK